MGSRRVGPAHAGRQYQRATADAPRVTSAITKHGPKSAALQHVVNRGRAGGDIAIAHHQIRLPSAAATTHGREGPPGRRRPCRGAR